MEAILRPVLLALNVLITDDSIVTASRACADDLPVFIFGN